MLHLTDWGRGKLDAGESSGYSNTLKEGWRVSEKSEERKARQAERQRQAQQSLLNLKAISFGYKVKDGEIRALMNKSGGGPIKGATASVQSEGEIRERFTATRIVALGVFALAFKKKINDKDVYLVIDGDGYLISEHVKNKKEQEARQFAHAFNSYAAGL